MDFTLKSGASLIVTPASFDDANCLRKALLKATKGLDIPLEFLKNGIAGIGNIELSSLTDPLIELLSSEDVENAIFKCATKAVYQNQRVFKNLFDDAKIGEQAREDYHEIFLKIIETNCKPFFKQTFSLFIELMKTQINTSNQKLQSM